MDKESSNLLQETATRRRTEEDRGCTAPPGEVCASSFAWAAMMISRAPSAATGGERRLQHVSVACGGLARPVRQVPGAAGPRPATPRPAGPAGGAAPHSGRAECKWWGAGARQAAAAAAAPGRQRSCRGTGRPAARVPTGKGNRELVRRALAPPAARGRGRGAPVLMRRWSFRPAPSRLRNASSLSSPSPASPRPRPL
ncbi:uncharacterized protein LOC101782782 [Setaria italica]|nr:uncharacterized protein LOC101782782 [Setaria italica]